MTSGNPSPGIFHRLYNDIVELFAHDSKILRLRADNDIELDTVTRVYCNAPTLAARDISLSGRLDIDDTATVGNGLAVIGDVTVSNHLIVDEDASIGAQLTCDTLVCSTFGRFNNGLESNGIINTPFIDGAPGILHADGFGELMKANKTEYTPRLFPTTGADFTTSSTYGEFVQFGPLVLGSVSIVYTSKGSGTGAMFISLPTNAPGGSSRFIGSIHSNAISSGSNFQAQLELGSSGAAGITLSNTSGGATFNVVASQMDASGFVNASFWYFL